MSDTYIPSDIIGVNSASIAAMKLDTFERMNKAFSNLQDPMAYPLDAIQDKAVPSYTQNDLFNGGMSKQKITEALYSDDPAIRQKAYSALEQITYDSPTAKGLNTIAHVPYERSMDKYLKGDFGYNPYVSMEDNEAFNYKYDYMDSSVLGRVGRNLAVGTTRFLSSVAAKTLQTFGHMGSMVWNGIEEIFDSKGNNAMADIADNTLSRWAEHWEEDMKSSNLLSVFKPQGWEDMGFFQKLGQGAFWTDEIADGAAFMGEMVLSSYMLGGAGKLAGLAKFGATPINMASKMGKFGKAADWLTKAATGADDIAGIGRWAFLTSSESAFEASGVYKQSKDELAAARDRGENNLTDTQISKIAGERAAATFKGNMAVLSLSNAFENRFIFTPLFGKAAKAANPVTRNIDVAETGAKTTIDNLAEATRRQYNYKTKLGKALNWKDANSRLRFYGPTALKSVAMEGFWEENAQLAIERLATSDQLGFGSFANQLGKQTKGALSGDDKVAGEAIGLGAVIGILGTGATSKITGERRNLEKATLETIKQINARRRDFLNFQDIYVRDENGKVKVDEDGQLEIDEKKAEAILAGISRFAGKQNAIDEIKNPLMRKSMQDSMLADYIHATKRTGIFDKTLDRFQNLNKLEGKHLVELGFDPNTTVDTNAVIDTIKEFGKIHDSAFENNVRYPGNKQEFDEDRKWTLFKLRSTVHSASKIAEEFKVAFETVPIDSPFAQDVHDNTVDVQMYNSIVLQEMKLKQFEEYAKDHGDFFNEYVSSQKEALAKEKEKLKGLLKDKIEDGTLEEEPSFGIITTPQKFAEFRKAYDGLLEPGETWQEKLIMAEFNNQAKHAELVNTANQNKFLADKISNFATGWENYQNYNKYIESVKKKDEEAAAKQAEEEAKKKEAAVDPAAPAAPPAAPPADPAAPPAAPPANNNAAVMKQIMAEYDKAFKTAMNGEEVDFEPLLTLLENNPSVYPDAAQYLLGVIRAVGNPIIKAITDKTFKEGSDLHNAYMDVFDFLNAMFEADEAAIMDDPAFEPMFDYMARVDAAISGEEIEEEEEDDEELTPEQQVAEWIKAGLITGMYLPMAEANPLRFLEFVAQQAQGRSEDWKPVSGPSAEASTRSSLGDTIVDYAVGLFPAPEVEELGTELEEKKKQIREKYKIEIQPRQGAFDIVVDGRLTSIVNTQAEAEALVEKRVEMLAKSIIEGKADLGDGIIQEGISIDGILFDVLNVAQRMVTLVNVNGVIVPFYLTTGHGGKGLIPGWYPFFGFGSDGWLNKTGKQDMETFYEKYLGPEVAAKLRQAAEKLNAKYGTEPNSIEDTGIIANKLLTNAVNASLPFTPTNNNSNDTITNFEKNLATLAASFAAANQQGQKHKYAVGDKVGKYTVTKLLPDNHYQITAEDGFIMNGMTEDTLDKLAEPEEEEEEVDVVPEEEWNKFVDTGKVSKDRLNDIAQKIIEFGVLSEREKAIHAAKASEIEKIIKALTEPAETDAQKKSRIATQLALSMVAPYTPHLTEEDRKFYAANQVEIDKLIAEEIRAYEEQLRKEQPPKPADEVEGEVQENELDEMVNQAKREGKFTFVGFAPHEIVVEGSPKTEKELMNAPAKIVDGAIVLTSAVGDQTNQALRRRNVLKKFGDPNAPLNFYTEENGQPKFKVRILRGNASQHKDWVYWNVKGLKKQNGQDYTFPYMIAVITDVKGEPIYFDLEGNITTKANGQPVAFSYSVMEYEEYNLNKTRRASMVAGDYSTLTHGFVNSDPKKVIENAIAKGIPVMGSIDVVTAGQLGTMNSINSSNVAAKNKTPQMRTLQEMVESGDISVAEGEIPFVYKTGEFTILSTDEKSGNQVQSVKKGMPYFTDKRSGVEISLRGKKVGEVTYQGKKVIDGPIKGILEKLYKDGRIMFEDARPEQTKQIFDFLRTLFYSKDVTISMSVDGKSISYIDHRPNAASLLDYEINFNIDLLTGGAVIQHPVEGGAFGSVEDNDNAVGIIDYRDFVFENFMSGAIPAHVSTLPDGTKVKSFEKLNKRVIFTLDKSERELLDTLNAQPAPKPTVVPEDESTQFVGKTYKTKTGTMRILEYDEAKKEYVYEDAKGKVRRTAKATFNKNFSTMTEITKVEPSEEVKQEMEEKPQLSKEEVDEINAKSKNMSEEDLDEINFDNC